MENYREYDLSASDELPQVIRSSIFCRAFLWRKDAFERRNRIFGLEWSERIARDWQQGPAQ